MSKLKEVAAEAERNPGREVPPRESWTKKKSGITAAEKNMKSVYCIEMKMISEIFIMVVIKTLIVAGKKRYSLMDIKEMGEAALVIIEYLFEM